MKQRRSRKGMGLLIAGLLLLTALCGCGARDEMSMKTEAVFNKMNAYDAGAADFGFSTGELEAVYEGSLRDTTGQLEELAPTSTGSTRKLIRTINLTTETLSFDSFVAYLEEQTELLEGYIESSSVNGNSRYGSGLRRASLTLRIPSVRVNALVAEIGEMATVTYKSETGEDVTLSYLDTESRVSSLRIQQERLLALLEEAQTLEEILQLEDRLNQVRYELEYYASMLKNYDNLVEYATVYINVSEVERISVQEEESLFDRMKHGLSDTFYDIRVGCEDFSVWFVINLPYLIFWGALLVLAVLLIRRKLRKRNARRQEERSQQVQLAQAPTVEQNAEQANDQEQQV